MVNSMTGYGEAEGEVNGVTYAAEIKALNNRYLKTSIKLPDSVAFLEVDIDRLLRKNLSRGMVNYVLRMKNISAEVLFDIDEAGLRAYVQKLSQIGSSVGVACEIDIGSLLNLPGIIQPVTPDEKEAEQIRELVLAVTQEALDRLKEMRAAEGKALAVDLEAHCKAIKQDLEWIRVRSGAVLASYTKKLKQRVETLLTDAQVKLDEETLAKEVALFADRSDISEEITRLDSHLQQFADVCSPEGKDKQEGPAKEGNSMAGRRLDFISQEMLREANTIASKALDAPIIRRVVDIKCGIDRIKEQVQNIE